MSLKEKTQTLFADAFGYPASHVIQAPGRVNLIGEHTDYNDGFVLPCAIDYQTVISCAPRDDRTVRVIAADYDNQTDEFSLDAPIISHDTQQWSNYVRGVVKHLQQRNSHFGGADLVISGNVPQGAGLSSSACWKSPSAPCSNSCIICRWMARKSPSTARRRKTSSSAATAASWIS